MSAPPECERCGNDLMFTGLTWTCMACFPYVTVETEAVHRIREALLADSEESRPPGITP